jgi:putative MFS transporter
MATTAEHAASITARIDRLPECLAVWLPIVLVSAVGIFEVYDLYETAYLPIGLARAGIFKMGSQGLFGLTDQATFAAATFLGLFLGAIGFSSAADKHGRRVVFLWALAAYSTASFLMALQSSALGVHLMRLLAGVGIGVELVTLDAYLVEIVPKAFRGKAFAVSHFVAYLAIPLLAFLAWLLIPVDPLGVAGWRWIVLISSVGALVVWWIRRALPESPRWLAQQGRAAEANRIVEVLEAKVIAQCGALAPPLPLPPEASRRVAFAEIWRKPYGRITVMLMVFNFFQTIGFFGFTNWLPTLLEAQGHSITRSLAYSFAIAIAFPLWPLLWTFTIADRFERKWLIVLASGATALLGLLFAELRQPALLIAIGVLITGANTLLSLSYHPYQAELYPTQVRARAVGFTYSFSRLSTVFTSYMIAAILGHFGAHGVFIFISCSMLLVMLSIGLFGPRTRGRALEEIAP